jgi:lysophospholipase L1-like esterase
MALKDVVVAGLLASLSVGAGASPEPIRVILVGDSTLAPHNGYGDALCARFTSQVTCINLARNGRSSGSYRAEGLWQNVLDLLADQAADKGRYKATYVLVEFGHNDQPGKPGRSTDLRTEFPANLGRYIDEVRAAGGTPVLVTPLTRRNFEGRQLTNDLQPWADADRAVAVARQAPLIDLLTASAAAVQAMGPAQADTLAVEPPPSVQAAPEDRNHLEAVTNQKSAFDHTHVGPAGANFFASLMVQLLRNGLPAMTPYFR